MENVKNILMKHQFLRENIVMEKNGVEKNTVMIN